MSFEIFSNFLFYQSFIPTESSTPGDTFLLFVSGLFHTCTYTIWQLGMKQEGIEVIYKYASPVKKLDLQFLEGITLKMDRKLFRQAFPFPLLSVFSFIAKIT